VSYKYGLINCKILFQQSRVENGFIDRDELDQVRKEMEAHYRLELNRKLSEVNGYLEEQAHNREKLDTSRDDSEHRLKDTNKKLQVTYCVI